MFSENCGGCYYHEYPYKAQIPLLIDGVRETRTFTCNEDVWEVIDLLIDETTEVNLEGGDFDVTQSVDVQIPFFACRNSVLSKDIQQDIRRYVYCTEFGVSPYSGSFGNQPSKWVEKSFIIKSAFAKKEKALREKVTNNASK